MAAKGHQARVLLNALVTEYLTKVDPDLAREFQRELAELSSSLQISMAEEERTLLNALVTEYLNNVEPGLGRQFQGELASARTAPTSRRGRRKRKRPSSGKENVLKVEQFQFILCRVLFGSLKALNVILI